jgi:putative hydrolase of the HAD superfamily
MHHDIDAIAFDLDGTLYPNYRLNVRLFPLILGDLRLLWAFGKARNVIRAAQCEHILAAPEQNKNILPDSFASFYEWQACLTAELLGEDPARIKEIIDRRIYRSWEEHFKHIKLFRHVRETLLALRSAGFKIALLSDFPPEQKLKNLGLADCWDAVLCSERSGALKPHPLSFCDLASALSLPPEKILYVGNNYNYDVVGARGAGMQAAWIASPLAAMRRQNSRALFTFHTYRQFLRFVI